jgi:uncharacterized protein (TIGR03083 family)
MIDMQVRSTDEFIAMENAIADLLRFVAKLDEDDWRRPTRCPPLDVAALVAHVAGSFRFVQSWLNADVAGDATLDRSSMWRAFPQQTAVGIVEAAMASSHRPDEVRLELESAVHSFVDACASLSPHQLAACRFFGPRFILTTVDVIANRVLEVAVHLLDCQHAVGATEVLPPGAGPVLRSILDGLLEQPLPAGLAWDDLHYARVATGRVRLTAHEEGVLGGLSSRLPLLT